MWEKAKKEVLALARRLDLPVFEDLEQLRQEGMVRDWENLSRMLTVPQTAPAAWERLREETPDIAQLFLYLLAACRSREKYEEIGIPEDIFLSTMGCFGRFLEESRRNLGKTVFDRGSWCWRHTALRIFRLGTLEFEYRPEGMEGVFPGPALAVHIPGDAELTRQALTDAYDEARNFFRGPAICPQGNPGAILCATWLLSPGLQELLKPGSGIRNFAIDYRICSWDREDTSFYRWLFRDIREPEALPRDTGLQQAVADCLEQGGKIGLGRGILRS